MLPTRPPRGAASKNCIRFFPAAFREGPRWNLAPNLTQRRPQSLQNHRLQRRHLLNRQRRKRRHRCHSSTLDSPGNKHVTGHRGSQAQEANKWQTLGANRPRGLITDRPWGRQVTGRPRGLIGDKLIPRSVPIIESLWQLLFFTSAPERLLCPGVDFNVPYRAP